MKKHKTTGKSGPFWASLVLMCALLLACPGCGGEDQDALVGTWEAAIDMTGMLNEELKAGIGGDEELMRCFKVSGFTVKIILELSGDGTYQIIADEEAAEASVDSLIAACRGGVIKYLEDQMAQEGLDMTVDELLGQMGTTLDGFMDQTFHKDDLMSSVDGMGSSGTFEARDSVLYLTDKDGTGAEAYELDGARLTLTGEGADDGGLEGLYPLVFSRKQSS